MSSVYDLLPSAGISPAHIHRDIPMSACTTFRVGGPADCLVDISSVAELQAVLAFIHRYGISHVVIGNGSNLLVRDGGIRGIVIRISSLFNSCVAPLRNIFTVVCRPPSFRKSPGCRSFSFITPSAMYFTRRSTSVATLGHSLCDVCFEDTAGVWPCGASASHGL